MTSITTKYQRNIDALPTAVRIAILTVILIITFAIWYYIFWQDMRISMAANSEKIKTLKVSMPEIEKQLKSVATDFKRKQILGEDNSNKIMSPHQTKTILHDILAANKDLFLLQLRNIPPTTIAVPKSDLKVFEHTIVISFLGTYSSTMNYLQRIEKLPWKIFWDKLEYKVVQYPTAKITLYIHTTTDDSGWIHV